MDPHTYLLANLLDPQAYQVFRDGLGESDRQILDGLLASAAQHLPAAQVAAHPLPAHVFLLALLLEEHKEVLRLRQLLSS